MKNSFRKNQKSLSAHMVAGCLSGRQKYTDDIFFCAHIGPSMNPTLKAQDLLEIKTFHNQRPQVGDIIFFQPPGHDIYVVHRIISITANGYLSRGDNSNNADPWFLEKNNIYGRVIAAHQGNRRRKIAGGIIGRLTGFSCQTQQKLMSLAIKLFGSIYRSLLTDGILRWLIPVRLTPQVATFKSATIASHRLLLGSRIIGSYDESLLRWQIRRPYRLFIDESSLPKPQ